MGEPIRTAAIDFDRVDEACVAHVKRAGFDGIDLSVGSTTFLTTDAVATSMRHLTQLVPAQDLKILSATWRLDPETDANTGPVPRPVELERAAELTRALGVFEGSVLTITPPPVLPRHPGDAVCGYQDALNLTRRALVDLCFEAERSGVGLALRAPSRGCVLSPVEARELIDALASPCIGVCIDTTELELVGLIDDWIGTLRHRILALRMTGTAFATGGRSAAGDWNLVVDPSGG